MQTHPRMLYRPGRGEGEMVWGHRIDTLVVSTEAEEKAARRKGWLADPNVAVSMAQRRARLRSIGLFLQTHWQWFIGMTLTAVLAIAVIVFQR